MSACVNSLIQAFQSTHPLRGATTRAYPRSPSARFQSTHPLRGATFANILDVYDYIDFNPRTPCGVRRAQSVRLPARFYFNPRTPCGVRPGSRLALRPGCDFNPRTPCGVRRNRCGWPRWKTVISIHAPLAGCDGENTVDVGNTLISIHAPLAGCDQRCQGGRIGGGDFNPRTPCGVRRVRVGHFLRRDAISIHAPLAGCDPRGLLDLLVAVISIHAPLAGCDRAKMDAGQEDDISIHAPLAGCDCPRRSGVHHRGYFNPRTPCGVRRRSKPTRPTLANFNPRTPCGVRRHGFEIIGQQGGILIHAPLAGCDQGAEDSAAVAKISIHAPLAGCDNAFWSGFSHGGRFQSTHPLRGAT